ncbi:MAG TPA: hypothetical protein VGP63_29050 [Planctomycetaceae bacterium]|nr:hypothetical protein [Planctomycetaceae bacterium]
MVLITASTLPFHTCLAGLSVKSPESEADHKFPSTTFVAVSGLWRLVCASHIDRRK